VEEERRKGFCLMVVAGEVSGDHHAAGLCRHLLRLAPDTEIFGMGGSEMASVGVEVVERIEGKGVVGIWEAVRALGDFRRLFRRLEGVLDARRPDALLLIDFPGFNLRFARAARRRGIPVIYYICPQVWAWGRGRLRKIRRFVNRLLVIFPFEREFFAGYGIEAEYVGHPLVDRLAEFPSRARARQELGEGSGTLIGLLPGSRLGEIERIYPTLLASARRLRKRREGLRFITPVSAPELGEKIASLAAASGVGVRLIEGRSREVMAAADLVLVASGTATLETALAETPLIVVYRVSVFSWLAGLVLIKIPWISLVNIVAGRRVVSEFIQHRARPEAIAAEAEKLLDPSGKERIGMLGEFKKIRAELGEAGARERAARAVLQALKELDGTRKPRE